MQGILDTIGNTPLVPLRRLFRHDRINVFAKLEGFNPGGSIKDRAAIRMLVAARDKKLIGSNSIIIESSSGNLGVGLAQACNYLGMKFICVADINTTAQNISIMRTYRAKVEIIREPDPISGEFLPARLNRVKELLGIYKNGYWPNQYANTHNAEAHYYSTMPEILKSLNGEVDYLFCAISSCGTLKGCLDYIVDHGLKTVLIPVDAEGSVIFGSKKKKRLIPGMGSGIKPQLLPEYDFEKIIHVSDMDCIIGCRSLVQEESILAGGSSGGLVKAFAGYKHNIKPGATCVLILPDRGDRYLDTIYSDEWVFSHFGFNLEINQITKGSKIKV